MQAPNGLNYVDNVISDEIHNNLIKFLMDPQRIWMKGPDQSEKGRLVQQFGYIYDYGTKSIYKNVNTLPIPDILTQLNKDLVERKILSKMHNQVIVNFYQPGQGITAHKDHIKYFGDEIATISLGSTVPMVFKYFEHYYEQLLKPASIAVLTGDSRWKWTHEIPARKTDKIDGKKIDRENRISITFRTVVQM